MHFRLDIITVHHCHECTIQHLNGDRAYCQGRARCPCFRFRRMMILHILHKHVRASFDIRSLKLVALSLHIPPRYSRTLSIVVYLSHHFIILEIRCSGVISGISKMQLWKIESTHDRSSVRTCQKKRSPLSHRSARGFIMKQSNSRKKVHEPITAALRLCLASQ